MTERKAQEEAGRAAAEAMGATPLRQEAPFTWRTPLGQWTLVGGVRRCATRRKDIDFVLRLPAGVEDWLPQAEAIARAAQVAGRACGYAVGDVFILPHDWPFAEFFTSRQWIDWQEDRWHLMDARQGRNERLEWEEPGQGTEAPTAGPIERWLNAIKINFQINGLQIKLDRSNLPCYTDRQNQKTQIGIRTSCNPAVQ